MNTMPSDRLRQRFESNFLIRPRTHPLITAASLVFGVIFIGTIGFRYIEDYSWIDAFYMCVISVSTVGFGEVEPLSPVGRLFTSGLIIAGVGTATYSFTALVRLIVEGELLRLRGIHRMKKKIENLEHHHIVCGLGRLGKIVVQELAEAGEDVVAIELDPIEAGPDLERLQVPLIVGSAYEDEVLKSAGIQRAKTLLALLPKDADNVYVTLCARDLNPQLTIIARTEDEGGESRLKRAGANTVLAPYRVSGSRLAQRLMRPNVSDFLEIAAGRKGEQLVIEEVIVPTASPLVGKSLAESDLRQKTGAIIAAFIRTDGEMIFNPGAKHVIEGGSTLIVLGEKASVEALSNLL
ncbi:MAG: potassium channel protein [Bdellovibrionales bacterium]|nr:potassium channel protein [Bdellovibrionales bacterium]